jgi:hypothetical protein
MAHALLVVHEPSMVLERPTVHKPRSVCMSAQLKVVVVLYEVAC